MGFDYTSKVDLLIADIHRAATAVKNVHVYCKRLVEMLEMLPPMVVAFATVEVFGGVL